MPRLPNESISQFAIRVAWETGHFWSPENPDGKAIKQVDLKLLRPDDPVVIAAMISMSRMDATRYTKYVLDQHGRTPVFDGELGPAMTAMLLEHNGRCPIPDYIPPPGTEFLYEDPYLQSVVLRMQADSVLPAFGTGNWKGCHQVGNFHCATVGVDTSGLPGFLKLIFGDVLKNVQKAYAGVGLLFRFVKDGRDMISGEDFNGNINTEMSFVNNSDGWIGLAIVGTGEQCGGKIWCKFLNTYRGGSDTTAIITQWTTLIKHELGHNCGRGHTNGGVMNPSIVNNLPTEWVPTDPSTPWLKGQFGGVPVPIPGGGNVPSPPNPPDTGSGVQKQLRDLQVSDAVQNATINWLVTKFKERFPMILLAIMLCCSSASAQVVSSDGRSIVVSGNGPVVTPPPAVIVPAESQKPEPLPDLPPFVEHDSPSVSVPAPQWTSPKSYLAMFTATYCGPCQRWKSAEKWKVEQQGYTVREYEMTNSANQNQYGSKIRGYPAFVVIDWETGRWLSEPQYGYIDSTTAIAMMAVTNQNQTAVVQSSPIVRNPPVASAPVRYVQWPGWGMIDLETYNRNCNCSMCRSIRGMQQEYRNKKKAFEQSQAQVTPDQEGTPHALVETMLDSIGLRSTDVLADLGCGDARILIAAAKRGTRGIGVELDTARAMVARHAVKNAGLDHMITIKIGDALDFDLQNATVATTYLYPPLLAKLSPKLKSLRVVASPYHSIPGLSMTQVGDIWIYRNGG